MAVQPRYLAYILEQLAGIAGLRSRRMFGGVGLYSGDLFFGLIDDDTLFFKTDSSNSAEYVARNMPRFMPFPERPEAVMAYYQVPADIIEDIEAIQGWARKSVAVALASHAAKARPTGRVTGRLKAAKKKKTVRRAKRAKRGKTR
jgi:DNA transformation protein and related proteins